MKKFYFFLIAIALGGLAACSEPEPLKIDKHYASDPGGPIGPKKPGTSVSSSAHRAPQKNDSTSYNLEHKQHP